MSQVITPELRQWIVEQAQAGITAHAVLDAMKASGWQEDVAIEAMETSLRAHLDQPPSEPELPPAVPVPALSLAESPRRLDLGDRVVDLVLRMDMPSVAVVDGLLSADECDALIAAARPRMKRSLTVSVKTGGEELNADRTSQGMFFTRGETELIRVLEARLARLVNWPVENGEGLQVLQYRPGAEYKPHYDYFDPAEPGTPTILKRGGQRVGTVIMYLNDPLRGGGTTFPDVKLEVAPRRGSAVFFAYDRAHPVTQSLHGGAPVLEGEKWVATKWLREREFN